MRFALGLALSRPGQRMTAAGLPALRVPPPDAEHVVGQGGVEATVSAERFELFRAQLGRRSLNQLRADRWDGDPEPYLGIFTGLSPRARPLVEERSGAAGRPSVVDGSR